MGERPRTWQQTERRALVADLVRTQGTLQARSEQLEEIFASRWYRLARFSWRLRRGSLFRKAARPRLAGEDSFVQPLNGGGPSTAEPEAGPSTIPEPEGGPAALAPMPSLVPPRESARLTRERSRLLFAGHSLGFCEGIAARARRRGAAVREDRWRAHGAHEEEASAAALAWAGTIHCEWCLGNAVWYSRNKLDGQRLVVRFHRMELDTAYPGELDLERVDAMVFVARHVLESACERWGWDAGDPRFRVVTNAVEPERLRLPKLPGAEHRLAMIGYVPRLKRLDRALDLLELLRARDERYRLLVKGREPWEYPWMAGREADRRYFEELSGRLERSPGLRGAVEFEPFDGEVPTFLRRAGWILSTSEVEGDSVSLAEGMASGAVPVVLERPGAVEQYGGRWVHADVEAAAAAMLAAAQGTLSGQEHVESPQRRGRDLAAEAEAARRWAERRSWERLAPAWDELLAAEPAPGGPSVPGRPRAPAT